jgi:hypothetical protein
LENSILFTILANNYSYKKLNMVKRKSRITERNTEPQKDNTLIATTPPPDSRVPGVIANHNAMVQ